MCNKILQHTARNVGKTYKSQCTKPEHKDGLCKRHYDKSVEKSKNWIERDSYREATQDDLYRGRSLKLRDTKIHKLYACKNGQMMTFSARQGKYIECNDIPADFNLFCVKI